MARSLRLRLSIALVLFPGVLGFKGCYFGNDQVPLGGNAASGGSASGSGLGDPSDANGAGEGGTPDGGDPASNANKTDDIDVVAFQFGLNELELGALEAGGAAGQSATP